MKYNIENLNGINKCFAYTCHNGNIEHLLKTLNTAFSNTALPHSFTEEERGERRRRRPPMPSNRTPTTKCNDSVIFVFGNCSIGHKSESYYDSIFSQMNALLKSNNCHICILRGGSDKMSAFKQYQSKYEQIHLLDDYTVVVLQTCTFLCVGGSIKPNESNEPDGAPIFDAELLHQILLEQSITCVITNLNPTFVAPFFPPLSSAWFNGSKELYQNTLSGYQVIDKIYNTIIKETTLPILWLFPTDNSAKTVLNDCIFRGVEIICFYDIMQTISQKSTNVITNLNSPYYTISPTRWADIYEDLNAMVINPIQQ